MLISSLSFGQKTDIEELINQVAKAEVPENFKYYYLVPKSLEQEKIDDSLKNYQIRELKIFDKHFPEKFINTEPKKEMVNWENYNLNESKLVSDENNYNNTLSPPKTKKIKFVKYNIDQNKYDSLVDNKEPYTLILKKKWYWNKNRIWKNKRLYAEFIENWKMDDKNNPEETIYYHFSKPIFSENKRYAILSFFKQRRCNGNGFTGLYRNDHGIWKKVMEFNQISSKSYSTHIRCEEIRMIDYE
ncbi:hypothetical protein DFQ05_1007 [Winogradskyella wandonensis]|uniref:Uncharacterized protein n=1 Tax=Winogradskyella wandonensis TaxID=1442586 RepID=A0A4R1KQC3_9FLAO|nr:hypothetical protein DFQ05_1007 [Winogradskyella wandonensis]